MWIYSITVFYNTLKLNHIILYHIWYLQHDKLPFYIYSRILPVLISSCCIEFNHYKTWIHSITVFYNTLMHNCIILYHIWYLQHDNYYIYSRILPVICCIFNHKSCEYSITVFCLSHHSVSYLISAWWTTVYIYSEYSQFWSAALNLITKSCEFTLLQYSTTLSSLITSFCIIFDICNMINYRFIYIPEYSQFWFHHAALNLITKSCEFTLLQHSTTLSSLITSFCIIFDICNMINYRFIYIPEYSQYWFQHAVLNLITTRREFTLLQYSTTLSCIIASFCIIFDICNMINYRFIYIPEYSQFWFHHAALNLITKSCEFTLLQYSTTLSSLITSFCIIFDICNMINYRFIYIPEYSQFWFHHAALNL